MSVTDLLWWSVAFLYLPSLDGLHHAVYFLSSNRSVLMTWDPFVIMNRQLS